MSDSIRTYPFAYPRKGDRPPWSWQGVTALTLAILIGGGWFAGIIIAALAAADLTAGLDSDLASLLNGIGQVLAGALGTYLGFAAGSAHNVATQAVATEAAAQTARDLQDAREDGIASTRPSVEESAKAAG